MGWMVVVAFLLPVLALHAWLLPVRPSPRGAAVLGYATCALAALALVCAASAWRGVEASRAADLAGRSAMDLYFVRLIHAIDAARDTACNTPPPKSTDAALLEASTRVRTTCAFYSTVWIEAGRALDLPGVLAAAQKPWPSSGSPRQQLWTYDPLRAEAARVELALRRPATSATISDNPLADALPFVLAGLLAVTSSTVTANLLSASRRPG